jgi:hypothetical protein
MLEVNRAAGLPQSEKGRHPHFAKRIEAERASKSGKRLQAHCLRTAYYRILLDKWAFNSSRISFACSSAQAHTV